jgi:hypothetical protein
MNILKGLPAKMYAPNITPDPEGLFSECRLPCARKHLDSADIVRDA